MLKSGLLVKQLTMEYILGVAVSLLAQVLKEKLKLDVLGTYIVVFGVSISAAIVYVYYADTTIWSTVLQTLATAGAFHNFVIRRFE